MAVCIDDASYLDTLPTPLYRNRYFRWKEEMLNKLDSIRRDLEQKPLEEVMQGYNLTPRDIALMVRLKYFQDDEIERYGLQTIEKTVPV